jgi:hypothetical protein
MGRERSWPAGGAGGRARGGQVPPGRGMPPRPSDAGLAGVGEPRPVVWPSHPVSPGHRPTQRRLRHRRPRRSPAPACESPGHRDGARRGPGADPAAAPGAAGRAGGRGRLAAARSPTTPPAHPAGAQAAAAAGEPTAATARHRRRPALDRCRNAGLPRQPGREPARRPRAPPGQLSPGVPARLGGQDLLHAGATGPAPPRARGRTPPSPAGG